MDDQTPLYVKDANGYCYNYSPALLKKEGFEPWDGEVDRNGFAVDKAPSKPAAKSASKSARNVKAAD